MKRWFLISVIVAGFYWIGSSKQVFGRASDGLGVCKACGCECAFVGPSTNCLDVYCELNCGVVDGECIDKGETGDECPANMTLLTRSADECVCLPGFFDCDGYISNGCESRDSKCDTACSNNKIKNEEGICVCKEPRGDYNGDEVVDILNDLAGWYSAYKSTVDYVGKEKADFNCDGRVDVSDLMVWYRSYKSGPELTAIPFPTSTNTPQPTNTPPVISECERWQIRCLSSTRGQICGDDGNWGREYDCQTNYHCVDVEGCVLKPGYPTVTPAPP